jgi:hypothetical protein
MLIYWFRYLELSHLGKGSTDKMKRIPLIFGLISTLLAFAATAPVAVAAEKTLILPEPTVASPLSGTGTSGAGTFETVSGKSIKCQKAKGLGTFTTANLGSGSVLFEGCTSALESTCTGVGDATGTIEQKGQVHFILGLEMLTSTTSTLRPVVAALVQQFHFNCTNTETGVLLLVLARGCVAGVQDGGEGLLSTVTVLSEKFTKGEPKVLSILMENNTKEETKCLLESTITEEKTGEKFELAVLIGGATSESFNKAGSAVTVLLMDK